jgi:integrase/recombinase XerD
VTHLRKMMLEELQRRNYSDSTARGYVRAVAAFAKYFGKPPDELGPDDLRAIRRTC